MIYQVTFNVSKDGNAFYQNFYVECNTTGELFGAVKKNMALIDGVVDDIHITQYITKQAFKKERFEK